MIEQKIRYTVEGILKHYKGEDMADEITNAILDIIKETTLSDLVKLWKGDVEDNKEVVTAYENRPK